MTKMKKTGVVPRQPKLNVKFEGTDLNDLKRAAEASGMSEQAFVAAAVRENALRVIREHHVAQVQGKALNAAFTELDRQEVEKGVELPAPAPAPVKQPVTTEEKTKERFKVISDPNWHPCFFLNRNFLPPNYSRGEIPGTCARQGLKPCHFHGRSAFACELFKPKAAPDNTKDNLR